MADTTTRARAEAFANVFTDDEIAKRMDIMRQLSRAVQPFFHPQATNQDADALLGAVTDFTAGILVAALGSANAAEVLSGVAAGATQGSHDRPGQICVKIRRHAAQ